LRILAGLAEPDSGRVEFDGDRRLSFVFQEPRLIPALSAMDNLVLALRGVMDDSSARARAERFLRIVGLGEAMGKKARLLSGGMRQRVALARAFAFPSRLLLMDEPFQSLDIGLRARVLDSFAALWEEEPRAVVFVTHDPDEALYVGDRVHIMGGRPARMVDSFMVPGKRGSRALMEGELLETERRVYRSLLGRDGLWKASDG
jgi:NitT/TauT family transport system ATP-binding protein